MAIKVILFSLKIFGEGFKMEIFKTNKQILEFLKKEKLEEERVLTDRKIFEALRNAGEYDTKCFCTIGKYLKESHNA